MREGRGHASEKNKKNKKGTSSEAAASSLGCSAAELEQLKGLLALLRSGSPVLSSLVEAGRACGSSPQVVTGAKGLDKKKSGDSNQKAAAEGQQASRGKQAATEWIEVQFKPRKNVEQSTEQPKSSTKVVTSSNATAVNSVVELTTDKACFCMASMAEAKKAMAELSSARPMAVLAPGPVDGKGQKVPVVVEKEGKECSWTRWLIQLGTEDVVLDYSGITAGGRVGATNTKVVVFGRFGKCPPDVWTALQQNPKSAVDTWLKRTVGLAEVGRLHPPRLSNEELSVVAEVPPGDVAKVEQASGGNGLFARRFIETAEDRAEQRIVPLQVQHDRLAALRIAKSKGTLVQGVVPTRRGWGIRVLAENFQAVLTDVNPTAQADLLGDEYVVSGLPLSWGSANVKEFLGEWAAKPVGRPVRAGFTNSWTVRAEQPPPASKLLNQDPLGLNVVGIVTKKEFRPRPNKTVLKMKTGTASAKPQLPKSWAERIKGTAEASSAEEPQARQRQEETIQAKAAETSTPPCMPSVGPSPANFMAQLQAMIANAIVPLQQEIFAIKEAMAEDAGGDEEDMKDSSKRMAENGCRDPGPANKTAKVMQNS